MVGLHSNTTVPLSARVKCSIYINPACQRTRVSSASNPMSECVCRSGGSWTPSLLELAGSHNRPLILVHSPIIGKSFGGVEKTQDVILRIVLDFSTPFTAIKGFVKLSK